MDLKINRLVFNPFSGTSQGLQAEVISPERCQLPFPPRTEGGCTALHHHRLTGKYLINDNKNLVLIWVILR